jgi:tetratricopeptide (TPR) repeat protein
MIDGRSRSYVHLVGPAGVGKTYLVHGLGAEGPGRGTPVLAYHILPGALADYRTFLCELDDQARSLRFRTPGIQARGAGRAELQEQFAEWASELIRANRLDALVIALDALDELTDPDGSAAAITDFLPPVDRLPERCHIVLTCRPELRPAVRAALDRLRQEGEGFTTLYMSAEAQANRELVAAYLRKRLPAPFRSPEHVEAVLERSSGVFLYAFHLCRALEAGAFDGVDGLPEGEQFYPAYLARLRVQVGDALFETVYLPALLLLAAAAPPVLLRQLEGWGLARDRLRFALFDLADFLRVHRVRRWHDSLADGQNENRYEIAHEAFVRFARQDAALSARLREAHAVIARAALARHAGRWEALDPADEADLYDVRHALRHARQAGIPEAENLARDGGYAEACFEAVRAAGVAERYHIAVELADTAVPLFEALAASASGTQADTVANNLANLLSNASESLTALGWAAEALESLDRAVDIFRRITATAEGLAAYGPNLARTLHLRLDPLFAQGWYEAALFWCDEEAAVRERLVAAGRTEDTGDALDWLAGRGRVLMRLGRYEEAERCFAAHVAGVQRFAAEGTPFSQDALVTGLINHGNALNMLDRKEEAVACYNEAVTSYRRVPQQQRNASLDLRFADALARRAHFTEDTPLRVRLADLDEAIAICRRLVEDEGRAEVADDLVMALFMKGGTCFFAGQEGRDVHLLGQALDCFEKGADLQRGLTQVSGAVEANDQLGDLLKYRAKAAAELGRWPCALESFTEAVAAYRQAAMQGFDQSTSNLADTLTSSLGRRLCREIWRRPELDPGAMHAFIRVLLEGAETCRVRGQEDHELKEVTAAFVTDLRGLAEGERARVLAALDGAQLGPFHDVLARPESKWTFLEFYDVADALKARAASLEKRGHADAAQACRDRVSDLQQRMRFSPLV